MIHVLYGHDTFSAQEVLLSLCAGIGPPDVRAANIAEMDASSFDLEQLITATQAVPFLAERRVVVIRGLLATHEPRAGSRRAGRATGGEQIRGLRAALEALPATSDVVFQDERLSSENPLLRALAELAEPREFPPLRRDRLARWVRERAAQKGSSLTAEAVGELVELVGPNLWNMDSELEKLTTYAAGRPIEATDVRQLTASARETSAFALVDAVMERRTGTALAVADELLRAGTSGPQLIALLARQARLVALAQSLIQERLPVSSWRERLGIFHEFALERTADQARRFTPDQIRGLYRALVATDISMKSGRASEREGLILLIVRVTGEATVP